MKYTIYIFILLFTAFTISCDDSFLEENKKQIEGYTLDSPLFVQSVSEFTEVSITLPDLKNKDFKVVQYPQIIHFESFHGHIDGNGKLSFKIKVDPFENPVSIEPKNLGYITLNIEGFGLLDIKVQSTNWGTPKARISKELIDFDINYNENTFEIENAANGILFYKLVEKPSWIKEIRHYYISNEFIELENVKVLPQNSSIICLISPAVEGLSPGIYEDAIVFETSDPTNPILTVKVRIRIRSYENPETMVPIEGTVIDAEFDKVTNTAIIITQNPAKLISYNADTKLKKEKVLDRNPYSVSLSGDLKTILLGESGQMQFIDLSTFVIKEKIDLPYIVSDIVDGENGYYYYSNKEGEIFSFNLSSKNIKKQPIPDTWGYETKADVLLKVKNKSQLALSKSFSSPNGFYLIDSTTPDDLKFIKYWHDTFGKELITTENGEYLFSFSNSIYKFPDENTGNTIYTLGELDLGQHTGVIWMHHSAATSAIWTFHSRYDSSLYNFEGVLSEYDDKTFAFKRKIALNDYVTTYNGVKDYYKTTANYFFATKDGKRLFLVKNIDVIYPPANAWHLEVIDVTN